MYDRMNKNVFIRNLGRQYFSKIGTHSVHVGSRKKDQLTKLVICDITLNALFLLRPPVGYGRVLNSPRFCFFSVSKVGLPLMGDTAVQYTDCYLSPCQHDF